MAEKEKLDLGEEKRKLPRGMIFIILGSVLVTVVAVFATLYFVGIFPPQERGDGPGKMDSANMQGEEQKEIIYLPLSPPFAANFKNNPEARTVQIEISVASTEQDVIDILKKHNPMLRNNLLLLLSGADPGELKTSEGKEAFRGKVKEAIDKIVLGQTSKNAGIDGVYFTGFIMQ